MLKLVIVFWITVFGSLMAGGAGADVFPLQVAKNGRYLVTAEGKPFFYHADTAWTLFQKLTAEEAKEYLAARKAQGFNVIQTQLTGFLEMKNRAGERPFAGELPWQDLAKPNEAYFSHIDRVMDEAERQGLLLAVAPAWSGCCGEGWAGLDADKHPKPLNANGAKKCKDFGEWLGERYGSRKNLLWILGGDNDPHNALEEIRAIGLGLRCAAPQHLITYHAASSHSSTDVWSADESWLSVSMIYTYFRGFNKAWNKDQPDVYEAAHAEYQKEKVRPFFLGESTYEGEHESWGSALQVRKQAYWALLGGACGHAYGSPNWNFPANWRETIHLPGAASLAHLRRLTDARPWTELIPEQKPQFLHSGADRHLPNNAATCAVAETSSWACVYTPTQRLLEVDLTVLKGTQLRATWFNPRDGAAQEIDLPTGSPSQFTPPAEGDWVLLIEDATVFTPLGK